MWGSRLTKYLPHNLEAEQALLGALLFDNGTLERICDLRAAHFYDPKHGQLFEMIADTIRAGGLADGLSLREWANRETGLKQIGGSAYLMRLMESAAPLAAQSQAYALLIRSLSLRRSVILAARAAADIATHPPDGMDDEAVLLEAQRAMSGVGEDAPEGEGAWRSAAEIALEAVERAYEGKAKGISTGLPRLDDCTGGGRPGTLWVLGGATSMGKSVGGQQFAVNVARQGYGVAYVHLEMDHEEVGLRLASALAWDYRRRNEIGERANPHYLSAANQSLKGDQWARLRDAALNVAPNLKIYVDDRPGRTVTQIESATLRLFQKMRRDGVTPGLIVVDHEGLIAPEGKYPSELEAARARANRLKDMAKRLGVWTIALSQITKEGSRADGEERLPQSTDLNYGSALSQAAHVVILIHRKAYYAERKPHSARTEEDIRMSKSLEATLVVDKARGGRRNHVAVAMDVASAVLVESDVAP